MTVTCSSVMGPPFCNYFSNVVVGSAASNNATVVSLLTWLIRIITHYWSIRKVVTATKEKNYAEVVI